MQLEVVKTKFPPERQQCEVSQPQVVEMYYNAGSSIEKQNTTAKTHYSWSAR
jgi:hypothetical protein